MGALDWLGLAFWLSVMAYMASGAWGAVFGEARRGDPMRLACFITAGIFVGYLLRLWLFKGDPTSGAALRLIGMADAVLIVTLGRAYGRGERV